MSLESDDSDVFDEFAKAAPSALSTASIPVQDRWNGRRLTSVFVVNPSELTQLGWYHTLYHLDDVLLVGSSGSATDAVEAVSTGWADLVLIDLEADSRSGRWIEQELAQKQLRAQYLFTADDDLFTADDDLDSPNSGQRVVARTPTLSTRGGVGEVVGALRASIDHMFNDDEVRLRTSEQTVGVISDAERFEARVRGNQS